MNACALLLPVLTTFQTANLWWGAGGLGVLVLTGAGFLWALREKLKRQRGEAAIVANARTISPKPSTPTPRCCATFSATS